MILSYEELPFNHLLVLFSFSCGDKGMRKHLWSKNKLKTVIFSHHKSARSIIYYCLERWESKWKGVRWTAWKTRKVIIHRNHFHHLLDSHSSNNFIGEHLLSGFYCTEIMFYFLFWVLHFNSENGEESGTKENEWICPNKWSSEWWSKPKWNGIKWAVAQWIDV